MRNDNCVGNESIRTNKSVGNEFKENIRDAVSIINDTRNDTNDVLSNSEPTPRDVTCSTAATMSGITTFGATNMYPDATIAADDATTERGRKINAQDIQNIFRESNTTGVVSMEQIIRIKRMHYKISEGVEWDFNYSCLLTVASIIAGIGLAIDSSTTVISSMLLSPIMGPVLGMSYGLIIWDIPLIKRSMKNELLSIMYIIIFGFLIGLCCSWTKAANDWPTNEMLSRATPATFWSGFPIAFFSGLGIALSVIDDQTSSLVGVAISASLLPPAVNCGMLWMMAIKNDDDWLDFDWSQNGATSVTTQNFSQMGTISLMLTLANVVFVACGATLMFRLKEVLPVKKKVFWYDLKVARRIYQGRAINPELVSPEVAQIMSRRIDEVDL